MASLRTSSLSLPHSSSSSSSKTRVNAAFYFPRPKELRLKNLTDSASIETKLIDELRTRTGYPEPVTRRADLASSAVDESPSTTRQMYAILEEVAERVEMHSNIGKQRENWNTLLLNSINMMTLTGTAVAGIATAIDGGAPVKMSSTLLFGAATGLLLIMNKIQPSQLAEEQRNAVRLFKQLECEIQSILELRSPSKTDVDESMRKVLALDRAYPLPLLGKMLEKFPKKFEPAVWWPKNNRKPQVQEPEQPNLFPSSAAHYMDQRARGGRKTERNGWSEELEVEMRAIVDVLKSKDEADYLRLGNIALKANKVLAVSGPLLTGIATASSVFAGSSGGAAVAGTVAALAGAVAAAINTFEHGGQVGMVVEMYRNCAGVFRLMEESIESMLEERDLDKRENGDVFERKVALKLGRSLSQLRELARKSVYSAIEGSEVDEFGSKLF